MNHDRESEVSLNSGRQRLAAHVMDCEACRSAPLPVEGLVTLLNAGSVDIDETSLSARTLERLRSELQRRWWRRVSVLLLLSLIPLPFIAAYDAYLLRLVYGLMSALLPATVAAYLVLSYGALLVLLFALTYAAIPLLVVPGWRPLPSLDSRVSTAI